MRHELKHTGLGKIDDDYNEYPVSIYSNKDLTSFLVFIEYRHDSPQIGSNLLLPFEIDYLEVTLANGGVFSLFGLNRYSHTSEISYQREVFKYTVDYIVSGLKSSDERFFKQANYSVSGIMKWGNISNWNTRMGTSCYLSRNYDNEITIFDGESYQIKYRVNTNIPFDFLEEEVAFRQYPTIIVTSKNSFQSITWFEEKFKSFKQIIEIALQNQINYQKFSLLQEPEENYDPIKNTLFKVESSFSKKNDLDQLHPFSFLFNCEKLMQSADLFEWGNKANKLKPVIDLYIRAYYSENDSMQNHFLNICQALETYHSRMISDEKSEYIKIIQDRLKDSPSNWFDFFVKEEKRKQILLSERIAHLVFIDNNQYLSPFMMTGLFNLKDFPKIISDTRNYYTHYNEKRKNAALLGEELGYAIRILRSILEFHLLRELGFKDREDYKGINEKFKQINNDMNYSKHIRGKD